VLINTRFPTDGRGGHGHHTASAILAAEVRRRRRRPRFPEQLQYAGLAARGHPGTPAAFFREARRRHCHLKLDADGYNPCWATQSYGEIAARSRSNHRSQGFGSAASGARHWSISSR
jgi:hypothetical protein